jgi:sugar lactone lactonase YvrE
MPRRLTFAAFLLLASAPAWCAQPQFWRVEGPRDFLAGETEGLAVDVDGRLRVAPPRRMIHDPEAPHVWCLAAGKDGSVFAGTGNDGRVFKVAGGKGSLFYDAPELEVHALAVGPDGKLYVGTSPDGRVYAVDAAGKATPFFDPDEKYIWALAFDRKGSLIVATGGDGKVYRVDAQGKGEAVLRSAESHILSLAVDEKGNLYAGSAPSGILYRIDPAGKVFVLLDSPFRELKAIEIGRDQSLYLAAIDGKGHEETARPTAVAAPAQSASAPGAAAEVTVTESFSVPAAAGAGVAATGRGSSEAAAGPPKAAVLRLLPTGELDTLWSSAEETVHGLAAEANGILVATGNKGKVYRVRDDHSWTMLGGLPAEQVTALAPAGGGAFFVATANPGRLYSLDSGLGARGTFVSEVKDTETVSSWGRISWVTAGESGGEVQVATRSGNTSSPDATWSDWSAAYARADGTAVTSERARFLQVRVTLVAKGASSPVLDSLTVAYLQRNLRPEVTAITVHPPGEVYQKPLSVGSETEILGLDPPSLQDHAAPPAAASPPAISISRKMYQKGIQTFSWKAEDANLDGLVFDVFYRPVADQHFRLLRKGLTDPVLAWDTSTVPNGRYILRVVASDAPSNPASVALTGQRESRPFDVDNTPPTVSATLVDRASGLIRATAKDDSSLLRRAESSVDGGPWEDLYPVDGINDSIEETYEWKAAGLKGPGPHVVVIRVFDLLGNASTARVDAP